MKEYLYNLCRNHIEETVLITTHDNRSFKGIIKEVDSENVYLQPIQERDGRFFPVFGAGLVGLGLGLIAGLTVYPPYPPPPYPYPYGPPPYGW